MFLRASSRAFIATTKAAFYPVRSNSPQVLPSRYGPDINRSVGSQIEAGIDPIGVWSLSSTKNPADPSSFLVLGLQNSHQRIRKYIIRLARVRFEAKTVFWPHYIDLDSSTGILRHRLALGNMDRPNCSW